MKTSRKVWVVLVLLLAGLGTLLFEVVPVETSSGWSDAAKRNNYLAAGRLLEKQGVKVSFQPDFSGAPSGQGVLFLASYAGALPPAEIAPLLAWVRRGNRLVLPAQYLGKGKKRSRDPLLSELGVVLHDYVEEDHEERLSNDKRLLLSPEAGWLNTGFQSRLVLEDSLDEATELLYDGSGIHVLRYELGDGEVVVLSETALFGNRQLNFKDNSALWLYLFNDLPGSSQVWLVYEGDFPGIMEILWRQARLPIISLGVLLLALLGYGNRRFGPLLPSPDQPRRRLAEHLQAAGRFLWYAGQQARLYAAVRHSLRLHLFRHHPHWRLLPDNRLIEELHRHTGLEPGPLHQALNTPPTNDLARFLQDMRLIDQLRKLT